MILIFSERKRNFLCDWLKSLNFVTQNKNVMLKIPYALSDYAALRADHCFFVDRTNYIEQLEVYATRYTMFLRPRRFGKSLFISILAHYYDVDKASDFQTLFGDLYIGKHPTRLANQYLILKFDFSGIETQHVKDVFASFLKKVHSGMSDFAARYSSLFSAAEQAKIQAQPSPASALIEFFDIFRSKQSPHSIYVLIDEYDQFTNELLSFHFADFKDIVSKNGYVRKFYEVLKTETSHHIARIFLTGVAPVTMDSMTSGFNITTDISLHPFFHDMMGFTEAEVTDLLRKIAVSEATLPSILDDLRKWYDGYRFDPDMPRHLYNPEMVLYFANYYQAVRQYPKKMLTANVATDYQKIAQIFRIGNNEETSLAYLTTFLETGEIKSYLTDRFNINMGFGLKEIWSMLFFTGMTTMKAVSGNNYTFQMPNYVIKSLYYDYFVALQLGMAYGNIQYEIREAIETLVAQGRIENFANWVGQALSKAHSNRDNVGYNEKHLKTLVIGLLFPYESYLIRSEYEVEKRFIDIFLERIPQVNIKYEILLELKYIKKENAHQWVDKDDKIVDPPIVPKKVAKSRKTKAVLPPSEPKPIPVKPLLDHVIEKATIQLAEYMELTRFQRPNLLGFCLVYVGNECKKILSYAKKE
jgi:Predicted AAA-ATPase/PD-(D/E)XK nuclease superfamily